MTPAAAATSLPTAKERSLPALLDEEKAVALEPACVEDGSLTKSKRKGLEARTPRHLVLHACKNPECVACAPRGKMRNEYVAVKKM